MRMPGRGLLPGLVFMAAIPACSGQLPPPQTRPIIIYSGERIRADSERMAEVERWLRPQLEDIETNPSFLIRVIQEDLARYPWNSLDLMPDTADIRIAAAGSDAETPFMIYAHLRLMAERGALGEWIPEAEDLEGFEAERAILQRVSDVWLLGRTVFDTHPFGPMDELLWASEFGYLEDFILATQGDRFPEALAEYRARNPEKEAEFRGWFRRAFERDEPAYLPRPESDSDVAGGDGHAPA